MNERLINNIKLYGMKYTFDVLAGNNAISVKELKRVVKENDLEGFVQGRFDAVLQDLGNHDKDTYTIIELSEKHNVPYMALYKYLVSVGQKHLCSCPVRWNDLSINVIKDMQGVNTVVEISRYMKAKGLHPHSRQSINQYMIDNNITPVTKYSRRLKNEQNGGSE